jgi:type III restriction enzyme
MHLYELLAEKVTEWRKNGYATPDYPAIEEILDYAWLTPGEQPRALRLAQIRALETYWYLRLVEGTPHITQLYKRLFPKKSDRAKAFGMDHPDLLRMLIDYDLEDLLDQIRTDDVLVKKYKLEALRETLALDYPSYILALAMGAGKTMLIGTIIATEFAMALETPDGPFIQNALVFAPGKTILDALRELADVPYGQILPPRLYKQFITNYKLTFTRDGEKDLPIIRSSRFNIVVTNTEKIRIQKRSVRSRQGWTQLKLNELEKQEEEIANLRLQAVASLPHLGIFSDEAHHTYGQAMEADLKRVRQTVNYLHENTNLVAVVNTTGTPYYQKQLLKDVIVWYSLSQGIRDDILKDLSGNIYSYRFNDENTDAFVAEVVRDFFQTYGDISLPNGAPAKLAMYFPQEDDLQTLRPVIEGVLVEMGIDPAIILRNTSQSTQVELDAFTSLNEPGSTHRVILLVNKGTEGWNCPSLFATALARKLRSSNNFVLQAATRCLRQVLGNAHKARVYLSQDNYSTLDAQLQETYGERLADLNQTAAQSRTVRLVVRKVDVPPLIVRRLVQTIVPIEETEKPTLHLVRPTAGAVEELVRERATLATQDILSAGEGNVLTFVDKTVIDGGPQEIDLYLATTQLGATYRLDAGDLYRQLRQIYAPDRALPEAHLVGLAGQIEAQVQRYAVQSEMVEDALALVRLEGFEQAVESGEVVYTTAISVPVDRFHLIAEGNGRDRYGFHYSPYNFDSGAEKAFFIWLVQRLGEDPDDIQDVYFTGGLTAEKHSDFYVEYKGVDGRSHRYVPDFLLRKRDGRCLIVEIKDARWQEPIEQDLQRAGLGQEALSIEGRKLIALDRWTQLSPNQLAYHVIFAASENLPHDDLAKVGGFLNE